MITKKNNKDRITRITFTVDDERPVSVVGDFNDWNPFAHPLVRRSTGTRSVALSVQTGSAVCFRYLADGGEFYDDPHADVFEANGLGGSHCVVSTAAQSAERGARRRARAQHRGMTTDRSWSGPARQYIAVYQNLRDAPQR